MNFKKNSLIIRHERTLVWQALNWSPVVESLLQETIMKALAGIHSFW